MKISAAGSRLFGRSAFNPRPRDARAPLAHSVHDGERGLAREEDPAVGRATRAAAWTPSLRSAGDATREAGQVESTSSTIGGVRRRFFPAAAAAAVVLATAGYDHTVRFGRRRAASATARFSTRTRR